MNAWTSVFTAAGVNDCLIDLSCRSWKKPGPADGSDMIRLMSSSCKDCVHHPTGVGYMPPLKCFFLLGHPGLNLIRLHGSLAHASLLFKRHLDWVGHFCVADSCDQHMDGPCHTVCSSGPHLCCACGLDVFVIVFQIGIPVLSFQ